MTTTTRFLLTLLLANSLVLSDAFVPFIDGGKEIPTFYKSWFDDQLGKQAASAVQRAISSGKKRIEVNFPPVPNVEEVKFGTPLNQKFGKTVVSKDLKVQGGYVPGSDISRNLIAFSNVYWSKRIASSVGGGVLGGRPVTVLSSEPVTFSQIKDKGGVADARPLQWNRAADMKKASALIAINPGGEDTWDRIRSTFAPGAPFVVLNNAYSTTYGLGNQQGYEEAYYVKRISKGWVFRAFPDPWKAYLEKPDGTVELLETYRTKPSLKEVATLVREESFKRYAINNDRWTPGFGERL